MSDKLNTIMALGLQKFYTKKETKSISYTNDYYINAKSKEQATTIWNEFLVGRAQNPAYEHPLIHREHYIDYDSVSEWDDDWGYHAPGEQEYDSENKLHQKIVEKWTKTNK